MHLKCSRTSFSPSSYSEKMRWGRRWFEETSQFNKDFIKSYKEQSNATYSLEVDIQYPKSYIVFIMAYSLYLKK